LPNVQCFRRLPKASMLDAMIARFRSQIRQTSAGSVTSRNHTEHSEERANRARSTARRSPMQSH
jgi:hypothetical protein